MKIQHIKINNIPAIIWGEKSNKIYIHVHGKMSCKEYAEQFVKIAEKKGYQTLSFDLPEHGERRNDLNYRCDIWNGMH
ncbi:MAG: alpha/beta hydrolase, partial [Oscillospiraceae bacterium]